MSRPPRERHGDRHSRSLPIPYPNAKAIPMIAATMFAAVVKSYWRRLRVTLPVGAAPATATDDPKGIE